MNLLGIDSVYRKRVERKKRSKWKKQRANRGFADCDVWNLSDYLTDLLPAMIDHLADITISYPGDRATFEEWQQELRDMANKFRKIKEIEEHYEDEFTAAYISGKPYNDGLMEEWRKKKEDAVKDAFMSIVKNYDTLWD